MDYDDRLQGNSSTDGVLDNAEEIAAEMAAVHCGRCYDGEVCSLCGDDTPLSREVARWHGMANDFRQLVSQTRFLVGKFGGDKGSVESRLQDAYFEAFWAAAAGPEDCDRCTDDTDPCGHEELGRECPAS